MVDSTSIMNKEYLKDYTNATETYKHCTDTIRNLKNEMKSGIFYIGATAEPEETMETLVEEKGLETMYLLAKTRTQLQAESLEKKLVNVFGKNKNNYSKAFTGKDQVGGGEDLNKKANYIFVMFGDRRKIKKHLESKK